MKNNKYLSCFSMFLFWAIVILASTHKACALSNTPLAKPTGEYKVGFQDFHWINKSLCPDPRFNKNNAQDFTENNKEHCHEVMVRIYYPTTLQKTEGALYYPPIIQSEQEDLKNSPNITKTQIQELNTIRSYTLKEAPLIPSATFPVIFFSPGFGAQVQFYENLITELVSHGYIVVGINSLFINGDIALPNNQVVKVSMPKNDIDIENHFLTTQLQDVSFTYSKIHSLHNEALFAAMDLNHIGALGHSMGARTIYRAAHAHPTWFNAVILLDIGIYKEEPIQPLPMPFMHIINAYWRTFFPWPLTFELGKEGYLVTLSPSEKNKHYSFHANYSDLSTFQYLKAYQALLQSMKKKEQTKIAIQFLKKDPDTQDTKSYKTPTFVLINHQNTWNLTLYEPNSKPIIIDITLIRGLEKLLKNLPQKNLMQFSKSERIPIEIILKNYYTGLGGYLGSGNGWEITETVRTYLIQFFNMYLKNIPNKKLKNCNPLTTNSLISCGS